MKYAGKVLIIDDEQVVRESMEALLSLDQHEIALASGAFEGLRLAQSSPPDVILVDVMMPDMNGFEVCENLRKDTDLCTVPIIMVTALGDKKTLVRGLESGADEFLTKPVSGVELRARVQSMLRIKRQQDQLKTLMVRERDLLEKTLSGAIQTLVELLAMSSPLAFSRAGRLRQHMSALVKRLGLPGGWQLELAAQLSQLGFATVPEAVLHALLQGDPLDENAQRMLDAVPRQAADLMRHIPRLERVAAMIEGAGNPAPLSTLPGECGEEELEVLGAQVLRALQLLDSHLMRKVSLSDAVTAVERQAPELHPNILMGLRTLPPLEGGEVLTLTVDTLRPGMVLATALMTRQGMLLMGKGQSLAAPQINRLFNYLSMGIIEDMVQVYGGQASRSWGKAAARGR